MANILYVAQTFHPNIGGAERYIDELAQRMARGGHRVFVMAPPAETEELDRDYTVVRTSFYGGWNKGIIYYLRSFPFAFKLQRFIRANRIDVVHFQYANPFTLPVSMLKRSGVRVYVTVHGSGFHFMLENWFGGRVLPRILRRVDGVVAVSDYCGELAGKGGAPKDRVHVVYNATDPDMFTPGRSGRPTTDVLTVCRLVPRKDIPCLLKAFDRVVKEVPRARLVVVGEGPEKESLRELAGSMGLKDRVSFRGFTTDADLKKLYARSALFVLPAKYDVEGKDIEGFGIVLLEAMASGRPVIGANVGGIPSAVKEGWGYLYEPGDCDYLGNKIIYLLKHPRAARRMGRNGRRAVEEIYNWENNARRVENIYGL